ncbi:hypothetical protein WMF20_30710 [Sorangium sp. So ce834]|uniref:hypothetical protein n=1 Tax=Sorangium sp. So ce834 TaxID=3133321 RepID=UPI003F636ED2
MPFVPVFDLEGELRFDVKGRLRDARVKVKDGVGARKHLPSTADDQVSPTENVASPSSEKYDAYFLPVAHDRGLEISLTM